MGSTAYMNIRKTTTAILSFEMGWSDLSVKMLRSYLMFHCLCITLFCSRGQCIPYTTETFLSTTRTNPCNTFYRPGIDYVYLPFGRALGDLRRLNDIAADSSLVVELLQPVCR